MSTIYTEWYVEGHNVPEDDLVELLKDYDDYCVGTSDSFSDSPYSHADFDTENEDADEKLKLILLRYSKTNPDASFEVQVRTCEDFAPRMWKICQGGIVYCNPVVDWVEDKYESLEEIEGGK